MDRMMKRGPVRQAVSETATMLRALVAGAAVALVTSAGTVSPAAAQDDEAGFLANERLINAIVAAVDAFPITLLDLQEFERTRALLLPPEDRKNKRAILEAMCRNHMFQAEFQQKGIVASDDDVEVYIDNVLQQSGSSRDELVIALEEVGLSWQDYFDRMRDEVQRLALINREIRTRVNVTPEEIERYWEERDDFDLPARVAISDIFIPVPGAASPMEYQASRRTAEEAYELAKKDGFAKAAAAYSRGPTAAEGGRLGEFATGSMAPEFEEALAPLSEGQFSKPFMAGGAYHIIRLDERLQGGRVPLEKVENEIRDRLYAEQLDARFQRWVQEDLVERHHVVIQLDEIEQLAARNGS